MAGDTTALATDRIDQRPVGGPGGQERRLDGDSRRRGEGESADAGYAVKDIFSFGVSNVVQPYDIIS
jgi:hypothetical protein